MGKTTDDVERLYRIWINGLQPGDQLPSERVVAEQLGVSRGTVRLVLLKLIHEGAIEPVWGKGYFVSHAQPAKRRAV